MNALQRFENFVERTVEGSFTRLFRSGVQPAEVARRIERAMEQNLAAGVGRMYAPNQFQVRLNPEDCKAFEPYRAKLEREMTAFVRGTAQEHGWELRAAPGVAIEANGEIARSAIEVTSRMGDPPAPTEAGLGLREYQPTAAMPIMRPATSGPGRSPGPARPPATPPAQPPAALRLVSGAQTGTTLPIGNPLISLGRELDNDVVIEDSRVSRHHAQILFQHNRYAVRDLDSTNHTFVNGQPIVTSVLASGDRISLGGFELQFVL